jgi:hypothetical protein
MPSLKGLLGPSFGEFSGISSPYESSGSQAVADAGGGTEVYGVGVCESRVRSEKKREKNLFYDNPGSSSTSPLGTSRFLSHSFSPLGWRLPTTRASKRTYSE